MKAELKYVMKNTGAQSVMIAGILMKLPSCVGNWDMEMGKVGSVSKCIVTLCVHACTRIE